MDRRRFLKSTSVVSSAYFLSGLFHLHTKGGKAVAHSKAGAILPLSDWTSELIEQWNRLPSQFPKTLWRVFPQHLRDANAAQFRQQGLELRAKAKSLPLEPTARQQQLQQLKNDMAVLLQPHLDIEQQNPAIAQSISLFINRSLSFDSKINGADVFQALRNVVTALFLQEKMQVPVGLTDSITAYSLLYPYTDNYLDEVLEKTSDKISFAERFRLRLEGRSIRGANLHEDKIFGLVELIEREYPRAQYPEVYKALLLIHDRQIQSLSRQKQKTLAKWSTQEVLDLTIQKGGASVLADAFLAKPSASQKELYFAYQLGFVLQLIDDLQDAAQDYLRGDVTLFTQAISQRQSLEPLVLKLMAAVENLETKNELFENCCYYLIAEGAKNLRQLPPHYPGMNTPQYNERYEYCEKVLPILLKGSFLNDMSSRFEIEVLRSTDERIERLFADQFDQDPQGFAQQLQAML